MTRFRWNSLRSWVKVARDLPATRGHYPDGPFAALTCAFCKAAEQPHPGTFESLQVLRALLDATGQRRGRHVAFLVERGDVVVGRDGRATLPNWLAFQEEGTSTPRVRQHRERLRNADGTPDETPMEHEETLQGAFHETHMERLAGAPPRRDSSHEEIEPSHDGESPIGRDSRADDNWRIVGVVEELASRQFGFGAGSPVFDTMAADVAALGPDRVEAEYRAVKASVNGDPIDPAGIVFGAHKRLYPIPGNVKALPKGKGMNPTSEEAWEAFGGRKPA